MTMYPASLAPAPAAATAHPAPAGWLGDWLLTFPAGEPPLPARRDDAPWVTEQSGPAWRLWTCPAGEGWRGAPVSLVETAGWSAWLLGELYTPATTATVVDLLAGRAGAAGLNGHLLLVAHHQPADEWHVWTNRYATLHAYYATDGRRTAVGTYMPAVAAAAGRAALDWEGLASFFGSGFFAADRTHLAGVRVLRPATHYHFDGRGRLLAEERYWHWRYDPDTSRTYDDTVATFAALFGEVMADLTAAGRVAVPISGGLDSRSTVAALGEPAGGRLWAYSYGYDAHSVETAIARRVAAARDLPFEAFTIRPYLFDRLPAIMAATEGFEDVTQCRQAAVVEIVDRRADFLIAAHLGDLYLADMGLSEAAPGTMSAADLTAVALRKIRKGGSDWLWVKLCASRLDPAATLRDLVAAEIDRLDGIDEPDFRIKAFKVDQWCARWTTVALRVFQTAAFPRLPFYDTRLADFFLTVPTPYLAGRRLQIDYLRRYAPDLARVPWQATGRDLFHDGQRRVPDAGRLRRGLRRLAGRPAPERNWEVQFLGAGGPAGLAHWLLRPGLALHEFVQPTAVRELLAAFERDPYTDKRGYTVAMLLTFSAWLEFQVGGVAV
jgi:hypothetical protein